MNEQGSFAAALLDSSRKAYAAGAVLRMQEGPPRAAELVRSLGFTDLVEDTQVRLQHLAESLAVGRTELFALDVEWLLATYAARELTPDLVCEVLNALKAELRESLPDSAGELAGRYLQIGIDRAAKSTPAPPTLLTQERPHVELAKRFLVAVLEGDRRKAESLVGEALRDGISVPSLHVDVITRVQAEIGRMWQVGEIHVAEEHLGSRIVEDILAFLRLRLSPDDEKGKTVLTASVAGNLHDIGARIVSDHFYLNGWRSIFLGADVPKADLVRGVADFKPDLLALSVGLGLNMRETASTLEGVRDAHPSVRTLVGGRPFALISDLWMDVGADGCALDATTAVATGDALLAG